MKKKRGLKRYFKALKKKKVIIPSTWIADGYFSYDKIWADKCGFKGINKRAPHLNFLLRNFDSIAEQASKLQHQFQIWVFISENSGFEDCVILHSPNPFTIFPNIYENLSQQSNFKNSDVVAYLKSETGFSKLYGKMVYESENEQLIKENFCILFKNNLGEPLT